MRQEFYTTREVSVRMGVSQTAVRNWCIKGEIPAVKLPIGSKQRYFVKAKEFDEMLEEKSKPAKQGRPSMVEG